MPEIPAPTMSTSSWRSVTLSIVTDPLPGKPAQTASILPYFIARRCPAPRPPQHAAAPPGPRRSAATAPARRQHRQRRSRAGNTALAREHLKWSGRLLAGEEVEQAGWAVVAEDELVVPVGFGGELGGPGKERLLVLGQGGFGVAGMRGDGLAELGAVEHRQVGTLA